MESTVAAIDVGSNSMRVAVIRNDCNGYLELIEEARAVTRLIHDVQASGALSPASINRVVDVMREFAAIAHAAGAEESIAVATSAVRDATNADELVWRINDELSLQV